MVKAKISDKKTVIDILYTSFLDNKSVNFIVKQDKHRSKRLRYLMEYSFDKCFLTGEVYLSDDRNGCLLITYPNRRKKFQWNSLILDLKLVYRTITVSGLKKSLKREALIKKNYPDSDFCYLWFIGVAPSMQGKGIGSNLLSTVIDGELPIYLETSTELNLPLYKRFGFEIYGEIDLGYKLYMLRR